MRLFAELQGVGELEQHANFSNDMALHVLNISSMLHMTVISTKGNVVKTYKLYKAGGAWVSIRHGVRMRVTFHTIDKIPVVMLEVDNY